jgi:hypothetical protein
MNFYKLTIIFLFVTFNTDFAFACRNFNIKGAIKTADAIVVGYPTSILKLGDPISGPFRYAFHVTRVLKGKVTNEINVIEPQSGCHGSRVFDGKPAYFLIYLEGNGETYIVRHPYPNLKLSGSKKKADKEIAKFMIQNLTLD